MRWAEWRTHDWRDQSRPTSRPARKSSRLAGFESGDGLLQEGTITADGLARFLAQVLHESGDLTIGHENMNYKAPQLMQILGVGRHSAAITPAEAEHLAIADLVRGDPRLGHEVRSVRAVHSCSPGSVTPCAVAAALAGVTLTPAKVSRRCTAPEGGVIFQKAG